MRLFTVALLLVASPLVAQDPMDVRGWINKGVAEFKSANYAQATADFQRAVQSDPSSVTAHLYLGTAWMQQFIPGAETPANLGVAAAASQEFERVLQLEPGNKTAMVSQASLDLNQKKWAEAQAGYEKIIAADPNNANAWYSLGFIAWSQWYPAVSRARVSLGMRLDDPGPLPASPIKEELKTKYGPTIEGGLRALHQGLLIDPKFDDAMAYINLLVRERADLMDNAADYQREIAEANTWVDRAMETKREKISQRPGQMAMTAPPPPPPPPPPPAPREGGAGAIPSRIRVSGDVEAANLLRQAAPVYPEMARQAGIFGPVTLSVVVSRDGTVKDAALQLGPALLGQAAIDAVRQWVYRPTLLNGEPVEVATSVTVNFQ